MRVFSHENDFFSVRLKEIRMFPSATRNNVSFVSLEFHVSPMWCFHMKIYRLCVTDSNIQTESLPIHLLFVSSEFKCCRCGVFTRKFKPFVQQIQTIHLLFASSELQVLSMEWFTASAARYKLSGKPLEELCEANAQVADSLGRLHVRSCSSAVLSCVKWHHGLLP